MCVCVLYTKADNHYWVVSPHSIPPLLSASHCAREGFSTRIKQLLNYYCRKDTDFIS